MVQMLHSDTVCGTRMRKSSSRYWFCVTLLASIFAALLCSSSSYAAGQEFFVSPSGTASGNGSIGNPWNLQTALNHPSSVKPGDTIFLRGGTYTGAFTGRLVGTTTQPIRVRPYLGERVILDAAGTTTGPFYGAGQSTWYENLEFTNTQATKRVSAQSGGSPTDISIEATRVTIDAKEIKLINAIIHDLGQGIGNWSTATSSEIYGSIIYNNGWQGSDRGHGHGIYAQNAETAERKFTDNLVFNQFGYGFHIYTEGSYINNMTLNGNVSFNNGTPAGTLYGNILMSTGFTQPLLNPKLISNITYNNAFAGGNSVGRCVVTQPANVIIQDNYFMNLSPLSLAAGCAVSELKNNTFYGTPSGFTAATYPENSYLNRVRPTLVKSFVRPNQYESGRAHVTVFNWPNSDSAAVDLSSIGLSVGDAFNVWDVQNIFGAPILQGIYDGNPVTIPLTGTAVSQPLSTDLTRIVAHTAKEFGVFLVRKDGGGPSTNPTPTHTPIPSSTPTSNPSIPPPQSATPTLPPPSGFRVKVR